MSDLLSNLLAHHRIIPVVTFEAAADAVIVGRALKAGGIGVIEVTLRTPAGLDALRALKQESPDLLLGAGTVLNDQQADAALSAGAQFLVSPGHTRRLVAAAQERRVPWMLGATSLSEAMSLREEGFLVQKFFPAEPMGGISTLKAIGAVLPDVRFCPTGGITHARLPDYLALSNVIAIGGSWFVPAAAPDSAVITEAARRAVATIPQTPV